VAQRLAPPSFIGDEPGLGAALGWTCSGALAASFSLSLIAAVATGDLAAADPMIGMSWLLFVVLGVGVFFSPFMFSLLTYVPFSRFAWFRTRAGGAVYGAVWHGTAHCLIVISLGAPALSPPLAAPLVVGALWGSWLPAVLGNHPAGSCERASSSSPAS
jgi:hypothetical protein